MEGNRVSFVCRDSLEDPLCGSGGLRAETIPTCSPSSQIYITFCGDYNASARQGQTYLSGESWLRTVIHEYAHAGCPGSGQILPAGAEIYRRGSGYPPDNPDTAIKNADSYAWFAMEVR
jgi:hypothetical protein